MTLQAHCGSDLSLGGLGDLPFVAFFQEQTAIRAQHHAGNIGLKDTYAPELRGLSSLLRALRPTPSRES